MFITPRRIVSTFLTIALAAGTVGIMTSPTPGTPEQDFAAQIQNVPVSPVVMRVGVVSEIVQSDSITVKISGSDILVQASYLFPTYQPLLGDRVVVYRQDAQWFVLGTPSGPNNSLIVNPGFEVGPDFSIPAGWSYVTNFSGAGPVDVQQAYDIYALDGQGYLDTVLIPTGPGYSEVSVLSTPVPAQPGQRWTAAAYAWGFGNSDTTCFAEVRIRWLNGGFTQIGNAFLSTRSFNSAQVYWQLMSPSYGVDWIAPPGTAYAQLELIAGFNSSVGFDIGEIWWDRAILRGPV